MAVPPRRREIRKKTSEITASQVNNGSRRFAIWPLAHWWCRSRRSSRATRGPVSTRTRGAISFHPPLVSREVSWPGQFPHVGPHGIEQRSRMKRSARRERFANDGGLGPFGNGGNGFELRKLGLRKLDGDGGHGEKVLLITAKAIPVFGRWSPRHGESVPRRTQRLRPMAKKMGDGRRDDGTTGPRNNGTTRDDGGRAATGGIAKREEGDTAAERRGYRKKGDGTTDH